MSKQCLCDVLQALRAYVCECLHGTTPDKNNHGNNRRSASGAPREQREVLIPLASQPTRSPFFVLALPQPRPLYPPHKVSQVHCSSSKITLCLCVCVCLLLLLTTSKEGNIFSHPGCLVYYSTECCRIALAVPHGQSADNILPQTLNKTGSDI